MVLQVNLTQTSKMGTVGNLLTLQPTDSPHSNLTKRKADTYTVRGPQEQLESKNYKQPKFPSTAELLNYVLSTQWSVKKKTYSCI